MVAEIPLGRFVWYELLTSDVEAAKGYYTQLIGWGTQQWEGGPQPYTMWTNGETPLGGLMALPNQATPPHWLAYIATPDVDTTVSQASDLGAEIVMDAMNVPGVGRMALLTDPQGAAFAVFTPAGQAPGQEGDPEKGEVSWHELSTTDYSAAFEFYHTLFGWERTESMDMGELGIYQMFGRNDRTLGGMFNAPTQGGPPQWLLYVTVGNVDASVEQVVSLGGQVLNGPMDIPGGGRIAQCMDPQGAAFALHSATPKDE